MARNCCLRSLLTMFHALTALGAGFFTLYSLLSWDTPATCLPKMISRSDGQVQFQNGLPAVCDTLVYGMGAVCVLNFFMCLVNNCLWENLCVLFLHTTLTTIYITFSVMGGTLISVYYMVWCDTLQEAVPGSTGCKDAAMRYDNFNTTGMANSYKSRMELQMITVLALFPSTCMALLAYSFALRIFAKPGMRDGQFRYVILQDETTPLVSPLTRSVNVSSSQTGLPTTTSN